jgi:hypothetical protein
MPPPEKASDEELLLESPQSSWPNSDVNGPPHFHSPHNQHKEHSTSAPIANRPFDGCYMLHYYGCSHSHIPSPCQRPRHACLRQSETFRTFIEDKCQALRTFAGPRQGRSPARFHHISRCMKPPAIRPAHQGQHQAILQGHRHPKEGEHNYAPISPPSAHLTNALLSTAVSKIFSPMSTIRTHRLHCV